MIKNLFIAPALQGRVAFAEMLKDVGGMEEIGQANFFNVTARFKESGEWARHPLHDTLLEQQSELVDENTGEKCISEIPIRFVSNQIDLNIDARYEAWESGLGRVACVGDGESARRLGESGEVIEVSCPGTQRCEFGNACGRQCKLQARMYFKIDGQQDQMALFKFQTSSRNSLTAIYARLQELSAATNGWLADIPLTLRVRAKSNTLSWDQPFFYADVQLRDNATLLDAATQARVISEEYKANGVDMESIDLARSAQRNVGIWDMTEVDAEEAAEFYLTKEEKAARKRPVAVVKAPTAQANGTAHNYINTIIGGAGDATLQCEQLQDTALS
jgi:hypothetical protein